MHHLVHHFQAFSREHAEPLPPVGHSLSPFPGSASFSAAVILPLACPPTHPPTHPPTCPPTDTMAWDMEDMASTMFVPIVFCLQLLAIALGALTRAAAGSHSYICIKQGMC